MALAGALDQIAAEVAVVEGNPHEIGEKEDEQLFRRNNGTCTMYQQAALEFVCSKGLKNTVMWCTIRPEPAQPRYTVSI